MSRYLEDMAIKFGHNLHCEEVKSRSVKVDARDTELQLQSCEKRLNEIKVQVSELKETINKLVERENFLQTCLIESKEEAIMHIYHVYQKYNDSFFTLYSNTDVLPRLFYTLQWECDKSGTVLTNQLLKKKFRDCHTLDHFLDEVISKLQNFTSEDARLMKDSLNQVKAAHRKYLKKSLLEMETSFFNVIENLIKAIERNSELAEASSKLKAQRKLFIKYRKALFVLMEEYESLKMRFHKFSAVVNSQKDKTSFMMTQLESYKGVKGSQSLDLAAAWSTIEKSSSRNFASASTASSLAFEGGVASSCSPGALAEKVNNKMMTLIPECDIDEDSIVDEFHNCHLNDAQSQMDSVYNRRLTIRKQNSGCLTNHQISSHVY